MIDELGYEFLLGDPSAIRAASARRQKTDKRDARHMLRLLQEDRFPAVWQPSVENEQLRQLLLHRCRLVRLRTRITNQSDSMGKNEGLLGSKSWSAERRRRIEALPLSGWYMQRRVDLLDLLDELEKRIEPLEKAVVEAAESHQQACLLMTQPGVVFDRFAGLRVDHRDWTAIRAKPGTGQLSGSDSGRRLQR